MKKITTVVFLFFTLLLMGYQDVRAQEGETSYQRELKKCLEASMAMEGMETLLPQMIYMLSEMYPSVNDEIWMLYAQEMQIEFVDNMVEFMEDIYKKYLTEEDLKTITAFYNSPVGQKLAKSTPMIQLEAMQAGQQLGIKISQRILEKLQGDGLIEL